MVCLCKLHADYSCQSAKIRFDSQNCARWNALLFEVSFAFPRQQLKSSWTVYPLLSEDIILAGIQILCCGCIRQYRPIFAPPYQCWPLILEKVVSYHMCFLKQTRNVILNWRYQNPCHHCDGRKNRAYSSASNNLILPQKLYHYIQSMKYHQIILILLCQSWLYSTCYLFLSCPVWLEQQAS